MTLIDTVMTCITDPGGAMQHLLKERQTPPYIVSCIVALFLILVAPPIIYMYRYDLKPLLPELTYAITITLSLTFVFFILFQSVFLRVVGVSSPVIKIVAAAVYALTPFAPLLVGYYIANWITIGNLSVIPYIVTGRRVAGDWFLDFLPNFSYLGVMFSFFIYTAAMRVIGNMGIPTGFIMGILAIPTLLGAYFIGLSCAESLFPNTAVLVTRSLKIYFEIKS